MGAFSTVLLPIVLIFAAGLIKLVIALMRKNPAAAKERVPFMLAHPALYPAYPCCAGSPKRPQRPAVLNFLITQQIDTNVKYPAQSGKTAGGGGRQRMKFERFNGHSTRAKISALLQSVDIFARNWHLSDVFCLFRCSFRTEICFEVKLAATSFVLRKTAQRTKSERI